MGWNAIDKDGRLYFEGGKYSWNELEMDRIEMVWLDEIPFLKLHRKIKNLRYFVHYYEFCTENGRLKIEGQYIGWSDGKKEYVVGISHKKHPHPRSES